MTVSAAASLQPAFEELAAAFTEQHAAVDVELAFDGSSVLAAQIIGGAPVDVFASADAANMTKVADEGLLAADPVRFATSSLQIAVAPGNPLGIETLADLAAPGAGGEAPIVVLCAAEVPCGAASHRLLERDGVALVPASEEQNVTAVLTKVANGEADAGLVYRSDVLRAEGDVEGIGIDGSVEAAGSYLIAPIAGSAAPDAAAAFAEFMRSDEAQARFEDLGFGPASAG
ncbi:molybdate ABC transporter substrate-binding protein [Leucobacter allii]|uniref:molybdate ABC transporter substrate-binding protein n=1 Tax=Leucobacter allii TaxID=2932247 RepID=UPI003211B3F4